MKISGGVMGLLGTLIAMTGALLIWLAVLPYEHALIQGLIAAMLGLFLVAMGYAKSLHEKRAGGLDKRGPPGDAAG